MAMEIDRKEIFRYLGYGRNVPDEKTRKIAEECVAELQVCVSPRVIKKEFPLTILEDGTLDGGCFQTQSKSLLKNLGGCGQVLLMAATLGVGADRLLVKYEKLQVSKAVVMQAAAAAMIETYCNEVCKEWKHEYEARGLYLRPRYSPGYGDFSLTCQKMLLDGLEAEKKLGIELTAGGLMVPTKSVTAVIGVGAERQDCHVEGCEACGNVKCVFRRS